ncbi:MAG TPA: multicopper oxidase family protein [Pseudonocardiaceae bacterium]
MSLGRRRFLGVLGAAGAGLALGGSTTGCGISLGQTGEGLTTTARLPAPYTVPLPVPPVARPVSTDSDTDVYELTQREASVEILPGLRTPILGYDGVYPGPTIVSRSGRRTVVRHVNALGVPTVTHLHGGHTPAASDGFPTDLVQPGDTREYEYPMRQRAATLWYHDHRADFTGPAVYRGLAGFHLVHDPAEDALGLPSGERDVPLMIADRAFEEDGALAYPAIDASMTGVAGVRAAFMEGVLGDVNLVNGAPWPVLEVDAARYRFRLLNGSNARRYELVLTGGPRFIQVGSDGGLLAAPLERGSITMAAGERFDVVVDFGGLPVGTEITMRNRLARGRTADVLRFVVARAVASDESRVPAVLGEVEPLDRAKAVVRREFRFTRGMPGHAGWRINNRLWDAGRVDAEPALGDLELWRFGTDVHHPVHLHLDPFQVVRRGAEGPTASDRGWKDTVDIRPGEVVEVLVRFTDYAGKYVMHCHNLEHEDMMMMANFTTR